MRYVPDFSRRSNEAELIDGTDYSRHEFIETLADLRRVNRWLGGHGALTRHLFSMIEASGRKQIRLLDVGTGSADIPAKIVEWTRRRGIAVEFVVLDLNEIAVNEARLQTTAIPEIRVVRADALQLPFADGSFDFVLASLFLHHFETPMVAALLKSFARVAREAFLVNDLRRHPLAYYSIRVLTQVFTGNRLVRNDAAVSVLRGFRDPDLTEIERVAGLQFDVFRHFPYRYILIGRTYDNGRSVTRI